MWEGGVEGLSWWLDVNESACNEGDSGSIPGSGRSPGEGIGSSVLGLPWWLSW